MSAPEPSREETGASLDLVGVQRRFGPVVALDDLTFSQGRRLMTSSTDRGAVNDR